MRILVVGSGGREHALCWTIAASPLTDALYCAPGNAGIAREATCLPDLAADDVDGIVAFAEREKIDMVVVGPEVPLVAGLVDRLEAAGIRAFGPSAAAAAIEGSKGFMKDLCARYGIPTAAYRRFDDAEAAKSHVRERGAPIVIKADGLAAGKGVTVCDTTEEAVAAIDAALRDGTFGASGSRVLIVERMYGREVSAHAFTDGVTVRHMPFSCDHKRIFDGNLGPNTGGMGVYSPPAWLTPDTAEVIRTAVSERAVAAMTEIGRPFAGVLYPGVMVTEAGPRVFEINARFGDPEAQVLLPKLRSDLLAILDACAHGRLAEVEVEWDDRASVGVVMASEGYPGTSVTGRPIEGVGDVDDDVQVFIAGAKRVDGRLVTSGGRVLCVVAQGETMEAAQAKAYDNVARIHFEGAQYRRDIGDTAALPLDFSR
jgi:phosphoribosylamine---glycine ligase